ncbi:MAG: hypothetical protein MUE41_15570 [Gemmatimonadaceae bacterium]|nr:hypothetical protein [Gemmatimonadaceae bacterium]
MIARATVALLALAAATRAAAPPPAARATVQEIRGRVITPDLTRGTTDVLRDSSGMRPVRDAWVTLHRIVGDSGGPVDSARTDIDGIYRVRASRVAGDSARYVASVSFGGIVYFTAPLHAGDLHDGDADLSVFDTTSASFPLAVRGRHVIVRAADSTGHRTVIEVFELSNDSARTLVSTDGPSARPTFRTLIPASARDVRAAGGDISAEAVRARDGAVLVNAPFAPGVKQLSFSYLIPAQDGALDIAVETGANVLEVLLEDSTAAVSGARLRTVDPVTVEGRRFRRSLAQDVPAGERLRVVLPVARASALPLNGIVLVVAGGAVALLLLMRQAARRAPSGVAVSRALAGADLPSDPDDVAREIAALDAHFAALEAPTDAMRAAYEQRRRELKDALARAAVAGR